MSMKLLPFRGAVKATTNSDGSVTITGYANKKVIDAVGDLMYTGEDNVDLTRFNKNPIMFFNHDRNQPIGRWEKTELRPDGLHVTGRLSKSEVAEIKKIRDLVKEGILNSLSIGYDEMVAERDIQGVNHVTKWKLNEVSIVSIPCNEDSTFELSKCKALGVELGKTKTLDEARKLMDNESKATDKPEEKPEEKPEPKEGKDFQECVQSKIPKLIEEGKTQEQAVAIAMSMCSEENGKCGFTAEHLKDAIELAAKCATETPDGTKADDEPPMDDDDDKDDDKDDNKSDGEKPMGDNDDDDSDETPKSDDKPEKQVTSPMPREDDNDFGNPYMDIAKSQLAILGQLSTQLGELLSAVTMLAIGRNPADNENDNQPDMDSQGTSEERREYSADEVAELLNIARQVKDITSQYIK